MNLNNKTLELKIEQAVRLLARFVPSGEGKNKPVLAHSLRVGFYLYENDYSPDIILAGFLHDIIEWTKSPEELIRTEFGQDVFDIVMANTKNREIEDKLERRRDYVKRCASVGIDALIVKSADTLDSFNYYQASKNKKEIERSVSIATILLEKIPDGIRDPIFEELREIK